MGLLRTLRGRRSHQRARIVAEELALCGSPGDRAAISGAAGPGIHRGFPRRAAGRFHRGSAVSAAVRCSRRPGFLGAAGLARRSRILTTSAVVSDVQQVRSAPGRAARPVGDRGRSARLGFATRARRDTSILVRRTALSAVHVRVDAPPAGVVVSHRNVIANVDAGISGLLRGLRKGSAGATVVSWLPLLPRHGPDLGVCAPMVAGRRRSADEPACHSFADRPAGCNCWQSYPRLSRLHRISRSNWPCGRTSDDDMAGLDLGDVVRTSSAAAERIHAATIKRFTERFARFNLARERLSTVVRARRGDRLRGTPAKPGHPPKTVRFDYEQLSAGQARPCGTEGSVGTELVSYGRPARRPCASSTRRPTTENPAGNDRRDLGARRQRRHGLLAQPGADGAHVRRRARQIRRPEHRRDPGCGPETWASCPTASCSSSAASRTC